MFFILTNQKKKNKDIKDILFKCLCMHVFNDDDYMCV